MPTTNEIRDYLVENSPWINPENTVDTVKSGAPDKPVSKVGVCWFAAMDSIKAAVDAGCDLLITHEPTFWDHGAAELRVRDEEPAIAKDAYIAKTGLTILRAHDTWDQWPGCGIRDSWAAFLGLDNVLQLSSPHNYFGLYEVPQQSLLEFAQYVADKINPLGEDSVQVMGEPNRVISKVSVGVGCCVPDKSMVDAGADVLIMCYDGGIYWAVRERMVELGAAIITVEHGTSEMPGMVGLRKHLSEKYPDVEFIDIAEHPRTWTVMASDA